MKYKCISNQHVLRKSVRSVTLSSIVPIIQMRNESREGLNDVLKCTQEICSRNSEEHRPKFHIAYDHYSPFSVPQDSLALKGDYTSIPSQNVCRD